MAESQWPVSCNTCSSSVEYNCNTCNVHLCAKCTERHKINEDSKHHRIVVYSDRLKPVTRHCNVHKGNDLSAWCDTCGCAVCMDCITSSCHRNHAFVKFEMKLNGQREALQSEYAKTLGFCSYWQKSVEDLDNKKETVETSFDEIDTVIKAHAEKLHRVVNRMQEEQSRDLQEHKQACLQNMNTERDSLLCNLSRFEKERNEYESILRSQDVVEILEYKPNPNGQEHKAAYQLLMPRVPSFTEGKIDVSQLEIMFGRLTFADARQQGRSKSVKEKGTVNPYENYTSIPRRKTMPVSRTESYTINTGWNAACPIVCIGHGQTWIATHKKHLRLFDKEGNSSGGKDLDFLICGAAIASNDDIMLLDSNKNYLRHLSRSGRSSTLFPLPLRPYGICPLHNGDVIITFRDEGKVLKYNTSGDLLLDFNSIRLHRPWNVAQNKVTKLIYIIDKTGYGFYKDPGRLVTCTMDGDFITEYTGHEDSVFTPVDVCSDDYGQVFITDYSSSRVHILNKDGVFKRYLEVNERDALENPCRIDINDCMYVWISEKETAKVKIIKYT